MNFLRSFLDNNSVFGQLMTRCGIIIAGNILFVLCSIPVVTAGAAWSALLYVMLKTLHRDRELNPFRTFWQGLKENWKQATLCWLATLILGVYLYLEQFWCSQFEGIMGGFRYLILGLMLMAGVLAAYAFPTLASFRVTFPQLFKNCVYFAVKNPVTLLLMLASFVVPFGITWLDQANLPLYGFIWCTVGFGAVAMFQASLLLKLYQPYLQTEEDQEPAGEDHTPNERQVLEDMKKLGM